MSYSLNAGQFPRLVEVEWLDKPRGHSNGHANIKGESQLLEMQVERSGDNGEINANK